MDNREAVQALSGAQIRQMWGKAEPIIGFGRLEDGDYICRLVAMKIARSQNGRLQLDSHYKVVDGPDADQDIHKFDGLETEQNMQFLKGYLEVLGVQYSKDDPRTLVRGCIEFVQKSQGDYFKIRLKEGKQGYQNVFLMGLIDYTQPEGVEGAEAAPGDTPDDFLPDGEGTGEAEFQDLPADGMDENFTEPATSQRQRGRPAQQPRQPQKQTTGGAKGRPLQQQRQTTRR